MESVSAGRMMARNLVTVRSIFSTSVFVTPNSRRSCANGGSLRIHTWSVFVLWTTPYQKLKNGALNSKANWYREGVSRCRGKGNDCSKQGRRRGYEIMRDPKVRPDVTLKAHPLAVLRRRANHDSSSLKNVLQELEPLNE